MSRTSLALALAVSLAAASARAAPPAAPSREEAEAVLQRWAAAQNRGSFDDYLALYAKTFRSVPRGGGAALDLAGWGRAREKMFRQPLEVKVDDGVVARSSRRGTALTFAFRWASGGERGRARKTITVASVQDHPAIVAEDLLCSVTLERTGKPVLHAPADDASLAALLYPGRKVERLPDEDDKACSPLLDDAWSVRVSSRRSLTTSDGELEAFTYGELHAPDAATYFDQWNGGGLAVTRNGRLLGKEQLSGCEIAGFDPAGEGALLTVSCSASYHGETQEQTSTFRVGRSGLEAFSE